MGFLEKIEKKKLTIEMVAVSTAEELSEQVEIDEKEAQKVIKVAQEELGIQPMSALKFLEHESKRGKITTSSTEFDSIL